MNQVTGTFLQVQNSEGTIKYSIFKSGNAVFGGAILIENYASLEIQNTIFQECMAQISGGAIQSSSQLRISDSQFIKNQALNGNDVYFKGLDDIVINNVNITASLGISLYIWAREMQSNYLNIQGDKSIKNPGENEEMKGLYIFETTKTALNYATFEGLFGKRGSAIDIENYLNRQILQVTIQNSIFNSNIARRGAGIHSLGLVQVKLYDTQFQNNQAKLFNDTQGTGFGGGILYNCPIKYTQCLFQIIRCNFFNNIADMDGGAVKFEQSEIFVDSQTSFLNNQALYGSNIASYPIHLQKTNNSLSDQIVDFKRPDAFDKDFEQSIKESYFFQDAISGQFFNLFYALVDHYGNVVRTDNSSIAIITTKQQNIYLEDSQKVSVNGYFDFSILKITIDPGSVANFQITTNAIPEEWLQIAREKKTYRILEEQFSQTIVENKNEVGSMPILIQFRKCQLGEIQSAKQCIPCPAYQFSNIQLVTEKENECFECPFEAQCFGKNEVAPNAGFWRLSQFTQTFISCPNESACIGGFENNKITSYTGNCAQGYEGILCQGCNEGWARYKDNQCIECTDNLIYDIQSFFTILFASYMIFIAIRDTLQEGGDSKEHTVSLLKIFAPLTVFSMDCYYKQFGDSTVLVKIFLDIVTPLVIMLLAIIFFIIYFAIKEGADLLTVQSKRTKLKNHIVVVQLVIVFVFHPQIVESSFSLFQCVNLGDENNPQMFFQIDPQLRCMEGIHLQFVKYLGIPSIVSWVLIIPFIIGASLYKYKEIIDRPDISETFGFITKGYRSEYFFWEIIIMYRKSFLVIGSVFLQIDEFQKGLNVVLYFFIWYMIQNKYQPFISHRLNQVESFSLLTCVCYIYISLYYLVNDPDSIINIVMIIVLLVVYFGYIFYFLLVFAKQKVDEITEQISEVTENNQNLFMIKLLSRLSEIKACICAKEWLLKTNQRDIQRIKMQNSQNQVQKWDWIPCNHNLKTELKKQINIWSLQPSIVLTNPNEDGPDPHVKLFIDTEKSLQYTEDLGWNWHKSWNLPNISVRLEIKDFQTQEILQCPKNLYAHIFAVKAVIDQADNFHLVDVGMRGITKHELINGQSFFQAIKFLSTSYNNEGVKFHLVLCIYIQSDDDQTPKILNATISPPIFVDSRKSAKDSQIILEKKMSSFVEPFLPDNFNKAFIKRENKKRNDIETVILNDFEGLFNYLTAPNIRHKVQVVYICIFKAFLFKNRQNIPLSQPQDFLLV
ncbi:zinc finger transcription factor sma, putative [Ichthyophthirius multifiliis]|uniref:Zinc finger transcription factor sma, putative n=1 Tax=Ichthyophthirius multifiliis TaxID=5932 RepID=G0R057_ICHMU|nr:zinc finger transcription factor sma, putative [Ichthyophthirius multifiliis]EGR29156.1 zinc finger transcription factor sma, putative [Ichthyophthirius multifiliis]|eukprot:XP_004030392.1 zinc finger transcription factor sma, putative [Ichthyophthirius multifiliis]